MVCQSLTTHRRQDRLEKLPTLCLLCINMAQIVPLGVLGLWETTAQPDVGNPEINNRRLLSVYDYGLCTRGNKAAFGQHDLHGVVQPHLLGLAATKRKTCKMQLLRGDVHGAATRGGDAHGVAVHADAGILERAAAKPACVQQCRGRYSCSTPCWRSWASRPGPRCVCVCVCVCVCSLSASSVALKSEIAASPLLAKVRRQLGWAEGILELPAPRTQSSTTQPLCPQQSQLCHVLPGTGPQHAAGFHSLQGSWTG